MSVPAAAAALSAALVVLGLAELRGAPRPRARPRLRGAVAGLAPVLLAAARRAAARVHVERFVSHGALARRVLAAGAPGGLRERDWAALKWVGAVGSLAAGLAVAGSMPGRLGIALVAAAPAAGFALPDFWLARAARLRAEGALRELPGMLDLLRVTIEAGRSPVAAMGAVGERFDGPLAAEWRAAAAQVALGVPHDDALAQMRERLPVAGVRALADALTGAHRAGLRLADVLAAQAATARHERRREIRERAARAGPKMQLVVALVLVPSVLLTLGAVLVSELTATGIGFAY